MGDVLLSHALARAVPSGLRGLTAVFGMGTGVTPSLESPKAISGIAHNGLRACALQKKSSGYEMGIPSVPLRLLYAKNPFYGQAERAISTG